MTTVVVQTLVIDPIWNRESAVASTPVSMLSTPDATVSISPSRRTASDAPGTRCSARRSSSRCWRDGLAVASDIELLLSGGGGRGRPRRPGCEVAERSVDALPGPVAGILLDADLPLGGDGGADRAARVEGTARRRVVR